MLNICQALSGGLRLSRAAIQCEPEMKFRRREKQIGVRLRSDQHAALREIAEREGYDSVSEFVRSLLEKSISEEDGRREKQTSHQKKQNSG